MIYLYFRNLRVLLVLLLCTFCILFTLPRTSNAAPPDDFVTTWTTAISGNPTQITIHTTGGGYNYDVDWNNDGTFDQLSIAGDVTHDFGAPGTYTIRIQGPFPRLFCNANADCQDLVQVNQWGTGTWSSMANAFMGASNMQVVAPDSPNLSGVTDMSFMFQSATAFNADISAWNVSSVTNMERLFENASNYNQPLAGWDTTSVTNMDQMFFSASSFNQDLGVLDVDALTSASNMLNGSALSQVNYDALLGGWSSQVLQTGVVLDASATYCDQDSRDILTGAPNSWTVNDGGLAGSCPGVSITESSGSTIVDESGASDSFDVVLDIAPLTNVVLDVVSLDTTEGTVAPAQLTFSSLTWNIPQTVTVTGVDDSSNDGDISFYISVGVNNGLSDTAYDPLSDIAVTIINEDDDSSGGSSGGSSHRRTAVPLKLSPVDIPAFFYSLNLTLGATGEDVRTLQNTLQYWGYFLSSPTGFFGPVTQSGLSTLQADVGITPSLGFFGPLTREYFNTTLSFETSCASTTVASSTEETEAQKKYRKAQQDENDAYERLEKARAEEARAKQAEKDAERERGDAERAAGVAEHQNDKNPSAENEQKEKDARKREQEAQDKHRDARGKSTDARGKTQEAENDLDKAQDATSAAGQGLSGAERDKISQDEGRKRAAKCPPRSKEPPRSYGLRGGQQGYPLGTPGAPPRTPAPAPEATTTPKVIPTPPIEFKFSSTFGEGTYGASVASLQEILIGTGDLVASSTGFFGPITKDALKDFQMRFGIEPPSGYFGPITMEFMNAALLETSCASTTVASTTDETDAQKKYRQAKADEQAAYDRLEKARSDEAKAKQDAEKEWQPRQDARNAEDDARRNANANPTPENDAKLKEAMDKTRAAEKKYDDAQDKSNKAGDERREAEKSLREKMDATSTAGKELTGAERDKISQEEGRKQQEEKEKKCPRPERLPSDYGLRGGHQGYPVGTPGRPPEPPPAPKKATP